MFIIGSRWGETEHKRTFKGFGKQLASNIVHFGIQSLYLLTLRLLTLVTYLFPSLMQPAGQEERHIQ